MQARILTATVLAISMGAPAWAQPASRCTHETLTVRGTPISAAYCVGEVGNPQPGRDLPIRVLETYSTAHGAFSRQSTLAFLGGEQASRVIEDVPLGRLGLEGTLHLTLALREGLVRVESAMLTPGAVTIK